MSLLHGFRILAVEQYGAAPFGTQLLAALGAEIIKVEQAAQGGDVSRLVGPHFLAGLPDSAQSLFFQSLNQGKKSITLNLAHPEGRAVFRKLAATAHGVVDNLRGDVAGKLGLTYEDLKDVNPAVVCAHISAYGRTGERAAWPGYDYLMQAEAGYFSLTGEPDTAPSRMGLSLVDYMTGVMMSVGLLGGMLEAARSGKGCDVDTSLYDVALFNLNYVAAWYLNGAAETDRQPRSGHPSLTPCQLYRTGDGWIYLMCNKEKFWRNLCERIGRPEWIADARFVDFGARGRHREELTRLLDEALSARTTAEWMQHFAGTVPAAPVWSVGQALDAPLAQADGRIRRVDLAGGGALRVLDSPLRTSRPAVAVGPAPAMGADTRELLAGIGIDEEEQGRLRTLGVL
ncbi:MAG: CoA-transferase [Bordetella sp. SCN 67-23]|nr:CoA transferase [Burkholderiales bacterium]ODS74142.1 MAG: CoA-transferase [Bordetella sp. SCN 67-23]ODU96239.1 MAG: CoA-transferase [Bordetella sp. SCN 68-11]OJW87412.1 MAG: CoA transferase [Burkholderiales bacterium 67-32]